jgi:hypothetical protein
MAGDAFRDLMAEARRTGRPELAHQSLGRPLSDREHALADALMAIHAGGITDPAGIAAALSGKGIAAPGSGRTVWTAALLEAELAAINADLDAAYLENGTGA